MTVGVEISHWWLGPSLSFQLEPKTHDESSRFNRAPPPPPRASPHPTPHGVQGGPGVTPGVELAALAQVLCSWARAPARAQGSRAEEGGGCMRAASRGSSPVPPAGGSVTLRFLIPSAALTVCFNE